MEIVSIYDPALDRRAMDIARYAGTQSEPATRDISLVRALPGREPVRFKLRELTRHQYDLCDAQSQTSGIATRNMAIAFGLEAVLAPGQPAKRPAREIESEGSTIAIWDEAGLDELHRLLGRNVMQEIAGAILHMSPNLGNVFGGSAERSFWLPPLLLLEAERTARRSAV